MGYVSCHCTDPRTACRDCVCPARLAGRLFEGLKATSSDPLIVYQSSLCLYMHTPPRADSIDAGLVLPGIRSGCPYGPRYHRLRASARWHRMKWPPLDVGAYPTTAMCRPGHDMSGHRSTVRRNGSTIDGDSVHGQSPPPGGGGGGRNNTGCRGRLTAARSFSVSVRLGSSVEPPVGVVAQAVHRSVPRPSVPLGIAA